MKSKFKKTLVILSSAILLFLGVFFATRSLNNLIEEKNKDKVISLQENTYEEETVIENNAEVQKENATNVNSNDNNENATATNNSPTEKYTDYIVQKGDTLYSIARKAIPWKSQQEAVKTIETMNNIRNIELIPVGSRLMVPVNTIDTTGCIRYVVKPGETLSNIAEEYLPSIETTKAVDMIMEKNNISNPNLLSIGLEIYIPEDESNTVNSNWENSTMESENSHTTTEDEEEAFIESPTEDNDIE